MNADHEAFFDALRVSANAARPTASLVQLFQSKEESEEGRNLIGKMFAAIDERIAELERAPCRAPRTGRPSLSSAQRRKNLRLRAECRATFLKLQEIGFRNPEKWIEREFRDLPKRARHSAIGKEPHSDVREMAGELISEKKFISGLLTRIEEEKGL